MAPDNAGVNSSPPASGTRERLKPGLVELRWGYVMLGLLALIDLLALLWLRGAERLIMLALLLAFNGLALWLRERLITVVRGYRLLQENYEQELQFNRQVMDNSRDGIMVLGEGRVITYANRSVAALVGLTPEQMTGRHPDEFIVPQDSPVLAEQLQRRWSGERDAYRLHMVHVNGQVIPVEVVGMPRWYHGRIVGQFAAIRRVSGSGGGGD